MQQRASVLVRELLHVRPEQGAHRVALRAGISVLVPLLTVLLLGQPGWSMYAVFGAFTSLYGRNHVHLSRAVMQLSAGTALTACVVLGALVGSLDARAWLTVAVGAAVAALGTVLSSVEDWHPPGPLFLVFGFGAVASVPHDLRDVAIAAVVAASSALFSLVVGNIGGFVRRQRTSPKRLAPAWTWQPARMAVAVLVAGGIATAVGIGHPYWAMVAAVAPLTARGITGQLVRAGHRVLGTLLGLLTSAPLLLLGMGAVTTVLVVGLLQIVTELLVGRNYGLALLFITPMALLMGQVAAPRPIGVLLFDRGVETVIGAAVAVAIVVLSERLRHRKHDGR
ncbi:MAG TPA: FUSC family protein [Nocardioidaceae bacterium]|nr:FUSC family protein [Nocardioidaceae bacterium]